MPYISVVLILHTTNSPNYYALRSSKPVKNYLDMTLVNFMVELFK